MTASYLRPHESAVRARARGLLRGHAAVRAGPGPARAVDMGRPARRAARDGQLLHGGDAADAAGVRGAGGAGGARAGRGDGRTHREVHEARGADLAQVSVRW